MQRHIPAEAVLSVLSTLGLSFSVSQLSYAASSSFISPVTPILISLSFSDPCLQLELSALAFVVYVSVCVCVYVRRSAWHKLSSSDIHINPHTTTSPPPPLKGTGNQYTTHGLSRFMD